MKEYNPKEIEQKWREVWNGKGVNKTKNSSDKPKYYILDMFPYPSGVGLHVGHPKGYIATDVVARMKMMQGYNVLHPMGWDAFGLPAENYAIANKVHPKDATDTNIATFKNQLEKIGFTYDWDREVNTTDPAYYKWTQWTFLQMYKKGLAFESNEPVNWCPVDKTVLANEDLEDGKCERCGSVVERKPMRQWVLKITEYADRMLNDLDKLPEWPEAIKEMQRNWIGRSEGAEVEFKFENSDLKLKVFTTRPDTLFGVTYVVVAPENSIIENLKLEIKNWNEVSEYVAKAKTKTDLERTELQKEKTGIKLEGVFVLHPVTQEKIEVWIADYVLANYGTGAVMAVPAHDERDFEFAKKYDLPVKYVVEPITGTPHEKEEKRKSIVAIVKNPKDGKLLSINWGEKLGGNLFIGGGLEGDENAVDCALREIAEETGYKDVKFIVQSEKIHHHYFAFSKNVYRDIEAIGLLFELTNGNKGEQKLEQSEQGKFKVEWILPVEANEKVKDPLHHYLFDKFIAGKIFTTDGISFNSDFLNGLKTSEAKEKMIEWLEKNNCGKRQVNYKLRDWVFSRQRYWGEPIPMIHCAKCGVVPVPEADLPVELPKVAHYEPTGTGESPLAGIADWVNTKCPKCSGPAKRETNTMPQWAGSSWYYLRYIDPKNDKELVNKKLEKYWSPVDFYVGGAEHATRHLIYARFWHKFLYDIGAVSYEEPFTRLQNVGLIMAEDGRKMSKRWGNVINPDDVIAEYGADALRVYEMFMGPFSQAVAWSTSGMSGARRFLDKVWRLQERITDKSDANIEKALHKTIKKVSEDIERMAFNTAISEMMIFTNEASKGNICKTDFQMFLQILFPFAPHMTEELWHEMGNEDLLSLSIWPKYDESKMVDDVLSLAVQVNGKLRATIEVSADMREEEIKEKVLSSETVQKWLEGKSPKKVIYVKGKLVSVVV